MAFLASSMACAPFNGSTAAQAWRITPGLRSRTSATYWLVHGGAPVTDSMSNATSIASTPAFLNSSMTSVSLFQVQARFQYFANASTYGPCDLIQGSVFG